MCFKILPESARLASKENLAVTDNYALRINYTIFEGEIVIGNSDKLPQLIIVHKTHSKRKLTIFPFPAVNKYYFTE